MALRRLGQIFADLGFITDDQLEMLVEEQTQNVGTLIGRVATDMGLITDDQLIQALGEQFNLQHIDLEGITPKPDAVAVLSDAMAKLYRVIPLQLNDNVLTMATCDPQNLSMQDELRRFLGYDIRLVVATEGQILKAIDKHFNADAESIEKIIDDITPVIFTLNHSKTNSAFGSKPTVFCLKWFHRRVTWLSRSQRGSRLWRT